MPSPPISAHSAAGFLPIIPRMRPQPPLRPRLLCTTWLRRGGQGGPRPSPTHNNLPRQYFFAATAGADSRAAAASPLPPVPKPQWKLARPTDSPHYYHRAAAAAVA